MKDEVLRILFYGYNYYSEPVFNTRDNGFDTIFNPMIMRDFPIAILLAYAVFIISIVFCHNFRFSKLLRVLLCFELVLFLGSIWEIGVWDSILFIILGFAWSLVFPIGFMGYLGALFGSLNIEDSISLNGITKNGEYSDEWIDIGGSHIIVIDSKGEDITERIYSYMDIHRFKYIDRRGNYHEFTVSRDRKKLTDACTNNTYTKEEPDNENSHIYIKDKK